VAYLGNNLQAAYSSYLNIDDIRASFNGVTTTFPLRVSGASPVPFPINPQQCLISVNGVVLRPDDTATEGFRLVGTNIVFKNAPAGGATFFGIILAGADYINVGANFPDGTATVPSITFDQDTDTGFYRLSSGSAGFTSNGTKTVTFDTSSLTVDVAGVNIRGSRIIDCSNSTGNLTIFGGAGNGANIELYGGSHPTLANLAVFDSNEHRFRTADGIVERLRIDSSGRVGIGTSSPENKFEVIGDGERMVCRNATNSGIARIEAQVQDYASASSFIGTAIVQNGSATPSTTAGLSNANLGILQFQNTSTGLIFTNGATPLVFGTTSVERMRLTGNGTLALGTSVAPIGTHEFCWQGSHRCAFRNVDSTASNCNGLLIAYDNAAPNGNVNDFLLCTDNATTRAAIRSNGGIANFQANNVNLSDINLKKNILPANSTWEHLKQWEIVSYQYKDQSNESDLNFGVIAQQVAEISPEVITVFQKTAQGQPDQLGVKEQQMYWMAIKALQEAVDRIETLENKVTALETA
jgi:hypothetical protein